MCGIAGIMNLEGQPIPRARERIWRMTEMLKYRGPDSQDVYISPDESVALGYTRLAIVDPLNNIKQPLEAVDGKAVLTFNGEIYNYLEIRAELQKHGIQFRSRMDTEVLFEGLRLEGESVLQRLDGMWAFAYYDLPKRSLLLSRDLMGERHIFYRIDKDKGEFIFASDVKPILADANRSFDIDLESLITSLRFYSAPPGQTLVKGIQRMLPGHNMIVEIGGKLKSYRYKKLHPEKWFDFFKRQPLLDEVIDVYEENFQRVCKRRLPLDVPYISTLSGGIDSALICAFASDLGKKRIKTLYGESADKAHQAENDTLDEYEASKFTSRRFNTNHIYTRMNEQGCVPVLNELAENAFDGMIDAGCASFRMLARRVREENLKVILISDGPDELLGGYKIDQKAYAIDMVFANRPLAYYTRKCLSSIKGIRRFMGENYISPFISYDPFQFIPIHRSIDETILKEILPKDRVLSTPFGYGVFDDTYKDIVSELDYSQMRALAYAANTLPDHFNRRTDKAFLGAAVECRLPYQAPEMAEFMIAMPAALRFGDGTTTKYLMRKIVERRVGPEIANRAKCGFSTPLYHDPKVYKALNFEEVIRGSPLFDDFPFKRGARELVLSAEYKKLQWPFFVLTKTYNRLKQGIYD